LTIRPRLNWRSPDPIHARAETIDTKPTFAEAFRGGQRGILLAKTFNEAPDIAGPTVQHTITPGDLPAVGIAVLWRRFEIAELPHRFSLVRWSRSRRTLSSPDFPPTGCQPFWQTGIGDLAG